MTQWIHQLLALSSAHPLLLWAVVFASAATEAVIVLGALMPGTAIILAASGMAGAANLSLWPLVLLAAAGAALGDGVSYLIGRHYGPSLGQRWPFSSRPEILEKGTAFFERHGGISVFIGRFVPGVKAVTPAIAGMVGMKVPRFLAANLSSGIIWSAVHVLPAAAAGVLLANVGSVSTRLLVALVVAFFALFLALWLVRLIVIKAGPRVATGYQVGIARLARSRSGLARQLARAFDPRNPKLLGAVLWGGLLVLAVLGFVGVLDDVVSGDPLTRADGAISRFIQSLRTAPLDRVMVAVTEFGDGIVVGVTVAALLVALTAARRWRSALLVGLAFSLAAVTTPLIKLMLHRQRPIEIYSGADLFSFPSGHSTFITLLFATLALLITSRLARRFHIGVWMAATVGVILVGFSRVYLGAHWPSDVMGGVLYGALIGCVLALLLHFKAEPGRAGPWCAAAAMAVFFGFGAVHVVSSMGPDLGRYAPATKLTVLSRADWMKAGWSRLPPHRLDLLGEIEEPLFLQLAVPSRQLAAVLRQHGWKLAAGSGPLDFLKLLSAGTELDSLPPWPLLHDGAWPVLMLSKASAGGERRLVLRLWPSSYAIRGPAGTEDLLVGSLTVERVTHPYQALTAMFDHPAHSAALSDIVALLRDSGRFAVQARVRPSGTDTYLVTPG